MKDKIIEEMARIIAFDLCPNRSVHAMWGEEAQCYSDNNFAECTKIKNVVDKLYNEGYRKIPEGAVVVSRQIWEEHIENWDKTTKAVEERVRKETAEKFAVLRKYITEQFHHYHEVRDKAEVDYKKEKEEVGKSVLNNDWHRADAIMFILEKVGIEFDEIAKEITDKGVQNGN